MSYWNEWEHPECNLADNGEHVKENGGCILCGALTLESQADLAHVAAEQAAQADAPPVRHGEGEE